MHRGKVDFGVSELPQGNELFRDYVNRPLINQAIIYLRHVKGLQSQTRSSKEHHGSPYDQSVKSD